MSCRATASHPPHRGYALRRGRVSIPGQTYLVTIVTRDRHPLFADFERACVVARSLGYYRGNGSTESLAWVVMPNHLHWLVTLGAEHSLAALMRSFKSLTARRLNAHDDEPGRRVWQAGYHDHAVRREEDLRVTASYIVANPLRAGLTSHMGGYAFWDAVWL